MNEKTRLGREGMYCTVFSEMKRTKTTDLLSYLEGLFGHGAGYPVYDRLWAEWEANIQKRK